MIKDKMLPDVNAENDLARPKQADPASQKTQPIDAASPDRPTVRGRKPLFRS